MFVFWLTVMVSIVAVAALINAELSRRHDLKEKRLDRDHEIATNVGDDE